MARKPVEIDLRHQLEALLFASGKKNSLEDIKKAVRAKDEEIQQAMNELMQDYENRDTPLMIVQEANSWKLTTREKFLPVVRKIVADTELSKTLMETLAVIAYKSPVKQSEVIDIRTNKAYEHVKELERTGYITSEKSGRTRLLKLSQKFFSYFDTTAEKIKGRFGRYNEAESRIKEKEKEKEEKIQKLQNLKKEEQKEEERVKEALDNLEPHKVLKEKLEEQDIKTVVVQRNEAETDETAEVKKLLSAEAEDKKQETKPEEENPEEERIQSSEETIDTAIEKIEEKEKKY